MAQNTKNKLLRILIYLFAFIGVSLANWHFQKPISLNNGQGFDGVQYCRMASQFVSGVPISAEAPFCYRLGNPFLVSIFSPNNFVHGFLTLNIVSSLVVLVLFIIWLNMYFENFRIKFALVLVLLLQWHGPFRFIYYYPVTSDNTLLCFILLGLICNQKLRTKPRAAFVGSAIVALVGVMFREVVLLLPFAALFANNPIEFDGIWQKVTHFQWKQVTHIPQLTFWIPLFIGIVGFSFVKSFAHQNNQYRFSLSAVGSLYSKPWPTYFHGAMIAYGPILALLIFDFRQVWRFLKVNQHLLIFLSIMTVFAYIGGSDTERIFYWAMPVVYLLIGKTIERRWNILNSKLLLFVIGFTQLASQRVFWTIPDYPNPFPTPRPLLTILSNRFQFFDLYSFHGDKFIEPISLAEYSLLFLILIIWMTYRANRHEYSVRDGCPDARENSPRVAR